ncbi:hypothetical protein JRI60_47970 [Archangium violaceum]|uniref:hypothetical protein n=1 Tax=Archangium violaceum TaxID=83451 RepID=UPI001950FED0|nr:hypothetical protein [Archangium violaceum]QRN96646.1 hypothetical protein JRI60_47970 [Archangium violaceum]
MNPPSLPETRTILADINTWYSKLPDQHARPLTGPTREADAILHGWLEYYDETLFLYGYTVGALEHCFFYDTPWDERGRVLGKGHPSEWYDGLAMPRPFRVRYSVAQPHQHEILDPLLGEMMKRPLHRLGTRPAVVRPFTASAEEVLAHIDRWDERLPFLRRRRYLTTAARQEASGWLPALARFGHIVGTGDASYISYGFEVDSTRFVFAVKLMHSFSRMTRVAMSPVDRERSAGPTCRGCDGRTRPSRRSRGPRTCACGTTRRTPDNTPSSCPHSSPGSLPPCSTGTRRTSWSPSSSPHYAERHRAHGVMGPERRVSFMRPSSEDMQDPLAGAHAASGWGRVADQTTPRLERSRRWHPAAGSIPAASNRGCPPP